MNYQQNLQRAIDLGNKAAELDNQAQEADKKEFGTGDWRKVQQQYMIALENWMHVEKYEQNPKMKEKLKDKIVNFLERAEAIKKSLKDREDKENQPAPPPEPKGEACPKGGGHTLKPGEKGPDANEEMEKCRKMLEGTIVQDKPNVQWSKVAGLDAAKTLLQETVIMPRKFPQLFEGRRKPWKGILLYGPPGTGKSYLAKAVATEADSKFFSLSSSDIVSKWQGDSEKIVKALFQLARHDAPTIIFIDEVDSMCGKRGDNESESSRRIKTEFLVQMDGVGNDSSGVLMLGATNCPWDLDSAIRRRFQRRVYIPLPDLPARRTMLELGIAENQSEVELSEEEKMFLAEKTQGFSGADITIFTRDALGVVITKCMKADRFKQVMNPKTGTMGWTPCSPADPYGVPKKIMDIPGEQLMPPTVKFCDFMEAMQKCKTSVSADEIQKNTEWTAEFGLEGS